MAMAKNHCNCAGCGKTFSGLQPFDKHRRGAYRDIHPHYGRVCRNAFHLALMGWHFRNGVWHEKTISPEERKRYFDPDQ